ncbi:hypothetical protein D3C79_696920 [compost metagenome]
MQRGMCQLVEKLVEQCGAGRVQRVISAPGGQLLDQLLFLIALGDVAQRRKQGRQGTWAIVVGGVQLQRLAVLGIPLHLRVG